MKRIAVIGSGMAGATVAFALSGHAQVTLFEKSRGLGGRMSTRRAGRYNFNHGAQYFTARSRQFISFLQPYIENGLVLEWQPDAITLEKGCKTYKRMWFEPHYISVPGMNSLCKEIVKNLNVIKNTEVTRISKISAGNELTDSRGISHGPFEWVICAVPAPQALKLIPSEMHGCGLVGQAKMDACYSLMLGFNRSLNLNWDAAKIKNSPLSWIKIVRGSSQGEIADSLVAHSTNDWAETNLEVNRGFVEEMLLTELSELTGIEVTQHDYIASHRWRYAHTSTPAGRDFMIDANAGLGVCGDWCINSNVEAAYLSGFRLSLELKKYL